MVRPISIRNEQDRFAIRCPGRWPIVPVIQGEAAKRAQLLALRQQLRQVNVSLELAAEQSDALSIARYADAGDRGLIVGNAGARARRPSCARIQVNPPKVKVCVVGRSLLQCIDQASARPATQSAVPSRKSDRIVSPRPVAASKTSIRCPSPDPY